MPNNINNNLDNKWGEEYMKNLVIKREILAIDWIKPLFSLFHSKG